MTDEPTPEQATEYPTPAEAAPAEPAQDEAADGAVFGIVSRVWVALLGVAHIASVALCEPQKLPGGAKVAFAISGLIAAVTVFLTWSAKGKAAGLKERAAYSGAGGASFTWVLLLGVGSLIGGGGDQWGAGGLYFLLLMGASGISAIFAFASSVVGLFSSRKPLALCGLAGLGCWIAWLGIAIG